MTLAMILLLALTFGLTVSLFLRRAATRAAQELDYRARFFDAAATILSAPPTTVPERVRSQIIMLGTIARHARLVPSGPLQPAAETTAEGILADAEVMSPDLRHVYLEALSCLIRSLAVRSGLAAVTDSPDQVQETLRSFAVTTPDGRPKMSGI